MTLRVLLVEDNPGDARLIQEMLRVDPEAEVVHLTRLAEGLEHLRGVGADVLLLDLSLPDSHGLGTFRKARAAAPSLPVVVLTGHDDDQVAVEAVRDGAQDYLVKGRIDSDLLVRALRYAVERQALITRLRELDRLKNLFLSVVSHDLKSPAAAILGAIDILLSGRAGELTGKQRHALELARRNAQRQTRLVNDLLDVTTIEAGALVLSRQPADLATLVQAVAEDLDTLATQRKVQIRLEIQAQPLVVQADADRLSQAVANLLSNALKFAASEVVLTVHPGDGHALVQVEDDGPGIPADMVDRLFLRFVRGIAEAHGGWVKAHNRDPGGALFVLALPLG